MIELNKIIENYSGCLKDSNSLRAVLSDLYPDPEYKSRIYIISVVLNSKALQKIKRDNVVSESEIIKLAKSLVNDYGFDENLCIECLELWSTSLGKYKGQTIKVNEIKENISKPTKIIKQLKNNMFTIKDGCLTKYTGGSVRKVTIPEGVTSIGANAFRFAGVQYVYLPSTCTSIEDEAFAFSEIAEIFFPDGLETIGRAAFSQCRSLRNVLLPPNIKAIYDSTFRDCSNLSIIELNVGLITIGSFAFSECRSLTTIEIPNTVKSISDSSFWHSNIYLIGEKGSYVEKYASAQGLAFESNDNLSKIKVGDVLDGRITRIKKFGAFVELPGGTTGLIHISEISSTYVDDISKFLQIGQIVKVKVLTVQNNKIALSIKQV